MEYELNTYIRKTSQTKQRLVVAIKKQTVNGEIICDLCDRPIQDVCLVAYDHTVPVKTFVALVVAGEMSKEDARERCNAQYNCRATHRECNDIKNGHSRARFRADEKPEIRTFTNRELEEIRKVGHLRWRQKNQNITWSESGVAEFIGQLTRAEANLWFYIRSVAPGKDIVRYKEMTGNALPINVVSPKGKTSTEVNIHFNKAIAVPKFAGNAITTYKGAINRVWLFWELIRLGFRVGEQADVERIRASVPQQFRARFDDGAKI